VSIRSVRRKKVRPTVMGVRHDRPLTLRPSGSPLGSPVGCPDDRPSRKDAPLFRLYRATLFRVVLSLGSTMSDSFKDYRSEVGEITALSDVPGWAAAWSREEARGWTKNTWAHQLYRTLDHSTPGNAFVKQMTVLLEAGLPQDDDRSDSITVVRRPSEAGYIQAFRRRMESSGSGWDDPSDSFVILQPPYIGRVVDDPPHQVLSYCRNQRVGRVPFMGGWHQAEFSSCPQPARSKWYARVPTWWSAVEVPFGAMVEVPPIQAYMGKALVDQNDFVWKVFRSEWSILAGAYLVDSFNTRSILWLYPRTLRRWIRQVGLRNVCRLSVGVDEEAEANLDALLTLLDNLPVGPTFSSRLRDIDPQRRDRVSWVSVRVEHEDDRRVARVNEDLSPYDLTDSKDVHMARGMAQDAGDWSPPPAPVDGGRPASCGGARDPSTPSRPTGPSTGRSSGERADGGEFGTTAGFVAPPPTTSSLPSGPSVLQLLGDSLPGHHDIDDPLMDDHWRFAPEEVLSNVAVVTGCNLLHLRRARVGSVFAAFLHTMVRRGELVQEWVGGQTDLSQMALQDRMRRMGRGSLRTEFPEALRTADRGMTDRLVARGYRRNSKAQ